MNKVLCPDCGQNLTEDVMYAAYGTGEAMPTYGSVYCPVCRLTKKFIFNWEILLVGCKPFTASAQQCVEPTGLTSAQAEG